ncbi:hypothetical protein DF3PA_180030 [Candidatus Defluviicoccus seviourii]|uniref:Uncharacterized protein n=1 Tax=Candidatus Defluviicoccus seviourii TaxID=2565273 RepID=A0A564WBX8_9PROT|nr:hypothetical protein DF3PA_180030 [Candidatus Defluviicoccus seviourii]
MLAHHVEGGAQDPLAVLARQAQKGQARDDGFDRFGNAVLSQERLEITRIGTQEANIRQAGRDHVAQGRLALDDNERADRHPRIEQRFRHLARAAAQFDNDAGRVDIDTGGDRRRQPAAAGQDGAKLARPAQPGLKEGGVGIVGGTLRAVSEFSRGHQWSKCPDLIIELRSIKQELSQGRTERSCYGPPPRDVRAP